MAERGKFSPKGRREGTLSQQGAQGEQSRFNNRRPIPGVTQGAETLPDTSYDRKYPPFRKNNQRNRPGEGFRQINSSPSGTDAKKPEKKLGAGWKGLPPRSLYVDPKDTKSKGAGPSQRDEWDLLSGDDLL